MTLRIRRVDMVVGGYTLDLYCDCKVCIKQTLSTEYRSEQEGFRTFAGQTNGECIRAAKKAGWLFYSNRSKCFAPGHEVG